jgi:hypothetical protein
LSVQISRRALAKALAASSTLVGFSRFAPAETPVSSPLAMYGWKQVHPGVWRATIWIPEQFTPVSNRLVPPQEEAFAKLPHVDAPTQPSVEGKQTKRGC